jgi:DNA end-binding protein Ku
VARSIWSGTVSFGLVSVPVRMFAATESKEVRFHFLDRRDLSPVGYDKVNRRTGEPVPADDVVRGFEVEQGRYVELTDEDVDRLDVELTHSIDICDFVSIADIDPLYFRKGYYLAPQEGAEKPYRLLVEALEQSGRVAVAKIVIRNKQHLACLRPLDGALVLETMYYADEVRRPEQVPQPTVRKAEVEMAKALVESLSADWDPERYHDRYRNELLDLLRRKAEGAPLPEPAEETGGEVVDLMEALRQSVEATKRQRSRRRGAARKAS